MKKITLVLGGIRSGKSHFAEQKALSYSKKPVYIATAIAFDEEMKERVRQHRQRRGNHFELIEAPYDLVKALEDLKDRTVLVDCLTLNLSNRLLQRDEDESLTGIWQKDRTYLKELENLVAKNRLNIIFVSNEVGLAPIESNKLGRYFQDLQGNWNRLLASMADEVYTLNAGIANRIKKQSRAPFKIGAPSYLLPSGYLENAVYLQDKVDDIQLLLFDTPGDDLLFKEETISTLTYLAKEGGPGYSAHMQVSPGIFSQQSFDRRLEMARPAMEKLAPLDIRTFTFHYDLAPGQVWGKMSEEEILWVDKQYIAFFNALKKDFPDAPISLENTGTPISALDRVVKETGISYCIDIGHLMAQDWPLEEVAFRLSHTPVVHLHGTEPGEKKTRDHRALTYDARVFKLLEDFTGILTLEVYHPKLFKKSLEVLEGYF